jgi:N-carbamoylputrescine amidase
MLLTVAATQMACGLDVQANISKAESLIRAAASKGARIILIQELFEGPYFCKVLHVRRALTVKDIDPTFFADAKPASLEGNPTLQHFSALAKELGVVIPVLS